MGARASGCAARTRSSSAIRSSRWSGRRVAGSPATSSRSAIPTTARCRGPRASASRDGRTLLPSSLDNAFVLDGPGRVRGQGGPGHRRPDLSRRRPRRRSGQAGLVRRRGRRRPHDPPRRHRSPPVRGEARRHRLGRHRLRAARRLAVAGPRRPRSSPSSIRRSSCRCRSATTTPTAPRRSSASSTRWARGDHPAEAVGDGDQPAVRDDDGPARVARQAGLTVPDASGQPRSRTTRPRLMTVRARSAAGQYGIWRRGRHAPDHEVGALARLERADLVLEPERPSRVDRHRAQRLVGRHPELDAGDGHRQRQAGRRRRARVEVGADGDRDAPVDERSAGAPWSFIRNQVVAGRTVATTGRSSRGGRGQRIDPRLGRRREMVGRRPRRARPPARRRPTGPARRRGAGAAARTRRPPRGSAGTGPR